MQAAVLTTRQGQYSVLELALPGQEPEAAGILLYDPEEKRLEVRMRRDWDRIAEPEDAEVLSLIEEDLSAKIIELGAEAVLTQLEDNLSHTLRIADREAVLLGNFESTLNRLYRKLVSATVIEFETHLPVFSCRAAAGAFSENMPAEAEQWMEAPPDLALSDKMFIAQVEGQSMEPRIPDGSWCIFRHQVVGSRQGKLLLVENFAESELGGQRYTIKRYRSKKVTGEDGSWEHEEIIMEPLNPAFEPWPIHDHDQVRVIAEFLRVLE